MSDEPISTEPFYAMTRRAGDTLYLSGFGPVDNQLNVVGADITEQGFGWTSTHGSGKGVDAITSGIEGPWTPTPTTWDMSYFDMLLDHEYELVRSPAGAQPCYKKSSLTSVETCG